jgi:hypothetical protein
MKRFITMLIILYSFSAQCLYADTSQQPTRIASTGETIIAVKSKEMDIQVKINARKVHAGDPGYERPPDAIYFPNSIVTNIEISVDNKPLSVPHDILCDLIQVNWAEINILQKEAILTLTGGDGAEAYIVRIKFDKSRIIHASWSDGFDPNETLKETTYYKPKDIE